MNKKLSMLNEYRDIFNDFELFKVVDKNLTIRNEIIELLCRLQ